MTAEKKISSTDLEGTSICDEDVTTETMFKLVNTHSAKMKQKHTYEQLKSKNDKLQAELLEDARRKEQKSDKVMKTFTTILVIFSSVFLLWVFASWWNVVAHNMSSAEAQLIWSWNFFKVFFP